MDGDNKAAPATTLVWDLSVRLFHWLLVLCIAGSWITAQIGFDATQWHARFGYAALTLILFRIIWGVIGSQYARFEDFVRGPGAILRYAPSLFSREPGPHLGHNPLGGLSVVAMLLLVLVQAGTGLFADDELFFEGPLNGWVSNDLADTLTTIHHINFNLLLAVIALHVAAVLWYWGWKRQNLVWPMVTGSKPGQSPAQNRRSAAIPAWRAPLLLLICIGLVAALVTAPA